MTTFETAPNPELMRSLGRLVRGLSALFWGLPITLVVCFHTARADFLRPYHIIPPVLCTGLLFYGLCLLASFQKQERIWRQALDLATVLALINFGLSPFLYFWNKLPNNHLFTIVLFTFIISAMGFLASLNWVIRRLGAMIPDEALRVETRQFTSLNLNLLASTVLLTGCYLGLARFPEIPAFLQTVINILDQASYWFLVLLVLVPLAMTMALLWKTKEVILDNVFGSKPPVPGS